MYYDMRHHAFDQTKSFLAQLVYPIQQFIDLPSQGLDWLSDNLMSHQQLQVENTALRAQVLLLKAQLQKYSALKKENAELRELLQSTPKNDEKFQVAELLGVSPEPFVQEFILNVGSKKGARLGQPVISANGLIGQIIAINAFSSKVLLITDSRSAIPIEDSRTHVRGILMGTGQVDSLRLMNIPASATIYPGDLLVTSGLDQQFPAGYPVGKITQISRISGLDYDNISVQPAADMNRVRLVLLVSKS